MNISSVNPFMQYGLENPQKYFSPRIEIEWATPSYAHEDCLSFGASFACSDKYLQSHLASCRALGFVQ